MKRLYKQLTRKQANVLFAAMKRGEIELTDKFIREMYDITNFRGYDDNGTCQQLNNGFITVIDTWFNDRENVQEQINRVTRINNLA